MIRKALFTCIACIVFVAGQLVAQDHWQASDESLARDLRSQAMKLSDSVYFERMISLGYVSSPEKSDMTRAHSFRRENTYLYLKLNFDTSKVAESKNYLIGTALLSERYQEQDYRMLSKTRDSIARDGVNMFCKLYYDRKNMEFRLNIYPDIIVDVCTKKMHGNKRVCKASEDGHLNAFHVHNARASALVAQPDSYYGDFLLSKITRERKFNYQKSAELYYVKNQKELYTKEDDAHAKYNYQKQIKNFAVLTVENKSWEEIKLVLQFTKYPNSDDFIENSSYEFVRKKMEGYVADTETAAHARTKADTTTYLTENSWNRTFVESDYPDDVAINELNSEYSDWYYLDGGDTIHSQARINARKLLIAQTMKSLKTVETALLTRARQDSVTQKEVALIDLKIKELLSEKTKADQLVSAANAGLSQHVSDRDAAMQRLDRQIDQINSIANAPLNALRSVGVVIVDTLSIANNDYPVTRSAFNLVDTTATKMANLSSRLGTNLSGVVDAERDYHRSVAAAAESAGIARANLNNVEGQLSEVNARRQRLISSLELDIHQKDALQRSQSQLSSKLVQLRKNFSKQSTRLPLRKERWIYMGRWRYSDTLGLNHKSLNDSVFNRFLFANYNRKIAIRDSLPELVGKYYYRGGIAETIEVVYGKYKEKPGKTENIQHKRYPRPGSNKREDLHNYFLRWHSREKGTDEQTSRTLKLSGNYDVTAFYIKPLCFHPIKAKGYIYLWAKVTMVGD